ncbi:FAD-dependent oxidoreductase [Streptomyces sp. NPDC003395]
MTPPAADPATAGPGGIADLAVVGAGPAGLAAAVRAAALGLTVTLLDAGERPGGQFHRHPASGLGAARPQALHHGWRDFTGRLRRLAAGPVTHLPRHHVWSVVRAGAHWRLHGVAAPGFGDAPATATGVTGPDPDPDPGSDPGHGPGPRDPGEPPAGEAPVTVDARAVLLATGTYERQLPFPGWTLPGVIGAGGAQAMLKSHLVLPGRRIVVAGSGPLLLAVAGSLTAAGARVPAVVEAAGPTAYGRTLPALLRAPAKLAEGARYGGALLRHGTRLLTRHAVTAAHGTTRVEAVTVTRLDPDWRPVPGTARRIPCDALAVGHGLVPQLDLATGLGCATRRTADDTLALVVDAGQATSVPGVWAAGEACGVGGADLAAVEGELAADAIAHALRGIPRDARRTAALTRRRARLRAFADALAAVHRPGPGWAAWLDDTTEVCRCEEVTAGEIRTAVTGYGALDARSVKLLTRAGMGWCQGRMCGPAVARLTGRPPAPDRRPLSCPVPLRHLAALPASPRPASEEPEA